MFNLVIKNGALIINMYAIVSLLNLIYEYYKLKLRNVPLINNKI